MNKKVIKNYGLMAISAILIGIGVLFFAYADLGADAMTTIEQGLSRQLKSSLVVGQIIANAFFFVLLFISDRKKASLATVLSVFMISVGIKLAELFVPGVSSMLWRYIYMFVGLVVIGLGIAVGTFSESGNNPYDGFILVLSGKIKKPFGPTRTVIDAIILVVGILLGGSYGVGTIVAIALQGVIANLFMKLLKK